MPRKPRWSSILEGDFAGPERDLAGQREKTGFCTYLHDEVQPLCAVSLCVIAHTCYKIYSD